MNMTNAAVLAALPLPEPFMREGVSIAVTSLSLRGELLIVKVKATCPTHDRYGFLNPPLVHDGETDPAAALVEIVGRAVLDGARRMGWSG